MPGRAPHDDARVGGHRLAGVTDQVGLGHPIDEPIEGGHRPRGLRLSADAGEQLVGGGGRRGRPGVAARGLPVRGICWYSRGDQYDWDTALTVPIGTVTEVGLFDAQRHPRPVAQHYAALARQHP